MKKIVWPIIAGMLLLTACQNSEPKTEEASTSSKQPQQKVEIKKDSTFPYPNLLADNDQTYSLLTIGEQGEQTPIEKDEKIIKDVTNILSLPTLAMIEKVYPNLAIENQSSYILFDNSGIVYQSKSLKSLKSFLAKNSLK
jgi:hypothetical protein